MAAPATAVGHVKLLLDEMHAPRAAQSLAEDGWDVISVAADTQLRGLPDEDLLTYAADNGRAIVTENVADFSILAQQWAGKGRDHAGLVFTNPRRFNRASVAYPGNLIQALQSLLEETSVPGTSWTRWLWSHTPATAAGGENQQLVS